MAGKLKLITVKKGKKKGVALLLDRNSRSSHNSKHRVSKKKTRRKRR